MVCEICASRVRLLWTVRTRTSFFISAMNEGKNNSTLIDVNGKTQCQKKNRKKQQQQNLHNNYRSVSAVCYAYFPWATRLSRSLITQHWRISWFQTFSLFLSVWAVCSHFFVAVNYYIRFSHQGYLQPTRIQVRWNKVTDTWYTGGDSIWADFIQNFNFARTSFFLSCKLIIFSQKAGLDRFKGGCVKGFCGRAKSTRRTLPLWPLDKNSITLGLVNPLWGDNELVAWTWSTIYQRRI